jgi:hypothetical protein
MNFLIVTQLDNRLPSGQDRSGMEPRVLLFYFFHFRVI